MAIGNPVLQGGAPSPVNTSGQTSFASPSVTIPANSLVAVKTINGNGLSDPGAPTQITDGTNTVTVADVSVWASAVGRVSWFSYYTAAGLTHVITASCASSNITFIEVYTIANAATSNWLDVQGSLANTSTAGLVTTSAPNSGKAAQADAVAIGGYCFNQSSDVAPTTFPGAGWTSLVNVDESIRHQRSLTEYVNGVTAGSTVSADCTMGASGVIARTVVVYKGMTATGVAIGWIGAAG